MHATNQIQEYRIIKFQTIRRLGKIMGPQIRELSKGRECWGNSWGGEESNGTGHEAGGGRMAAFRRREGGQRERGERM